MKAALDVIETVRQEYREASMFSRGALVDGRTPPSQRHVMSHGDPKFRSSSSVKHYYEMYATYYFSPIYLPSEALRHGPVDVSVVEKVCF